MKRTIKEVYNLIKEKEDSAQKHLERLLTYIPPSTEPIKDPVCNQLQGSINAYRDVLYLMESSHLLDEDKPIKNKELTAITALGNLFKIADIGIADEKYRKEKSKEYYDIVRTYIEKALLYIHKLEEERKSYA